MTRLTAVVALVVVFAACGEKSTAPKTISPPPPAAVASVTIDPSSASLEVGQQSLVEARTRDASGATLTGRVVQWQSSAPAVATVTTSGTSATVAAIAPGVVTISATSEGKSANATITVVALPAMDFAITDAQWTQGVQHADGTIPMVLDGNAAVLNVIMSTTVANRAPGQVKLTLTDAAGTVVRTDSVTPSAFAGAATYAAPTAQFFVPASQLRAGLRWAVRRDPGRVLEDGYSANDVFPRTGTAMLATVSLPVMRVRFVPITLSAHNNATGNVSTANVEGYLAMMRRVFPLGRLVTSIGTPLVTSASFGTPPTGGGEPFWLQILQDLLLARVADPTAQDEYFLGVIVPPTGFNFATFGGFASVPASLSSSARIASVVQTGWFTNTSLTSDLVAHELAHTLGRRHAPCGNASGADPAFPFANGTIGIPGHDVYSTSIGLTVFPSTLPATTGDLMGYCHPQWASTYTYSGILQARIASGPIAITAAAATRQPVVVVRGSIENNRIALLPTISIDGVATTGASGDLYVELLSDDGRVLASQRTDAVPVDHSDAMTFLAALPLDERAAASLASVRVTGRGGVVTRGRPRTALSSGTRDRTASVASLRTLASRQIEAACTIPDAEAIVVQDHTTGVLLASATESHVALGSTTATAIDISCSDGVRTERLLAMPTNRP